MLTYSILFFSALLCCAGHDVPDFNFTLSSKHNQTGHWFAQVQLGHKEDQTWDVYVDHTTINWNGTKSILIDSKIIAPLIEENNNRSTVDYTSLASLGYLLLPGLGYYKLHTTRAPWRKALEICSQDGTHLLIINSEQEEKAILSLIDNAGRPTSWYWTGVHDHYNEGHYTTIFNTSLESTGYVKWYRQQPDGGTSQNCMWFVYYGSEQYGLNDGTCSDADAVICELEL